MRLPLFLAACALAAPAGAEIVSSNDNAFHVRHEVTVKVSPAEAYDLLIEPKKWWHPEHNWSGSSDNLAIDARAGGCFCETLADGGSAVHMMIWQAKPGERLTMVGGLGPLLFAPATGTMDWTFKEGDEGTTISMNYKVFGFTDGDGVKWSEAVDYVLGVQVKRLQDAANQ